MKTTWTPEAIRGLGTRTDMRTACSVIGIGETKGRELARAGRFPVRVIKVGAVYVVPVSGLLELLDIHTPAGAA